MRAQITDYMTRGEHAVLVTRLEAIARELDGLRAEFPAFDAINIHVREDYMDATVSNDKVIIAHTSAGDYIGDRVIVQDELAQAAV